jgi:DNA-binding MarR family transcriptional regulator
MLEGATSGSNRAATRLMEALDGVIVRRDRDISRILATHGLTIGQWKCLAAVQPHRGAAMSHVAAKSGIDRTVASRIVDKLVDLGFFERTIPREDRRQIILSLTPTGIERVEALRTMIALLDAHHLQHLTQQDMRQALEIISRINT